MIDRRIPAWRRDFNDIVRDESGQVSLGKLGAFAGQIIAGKLLIEHSQFVIDRPEALAILLTALIAPEVIKKLLTMKYGSFDPPVTRTIASAEVTTVTEQSKKGKK